MSYYSSPHDSVNPAVYGVVKWIFLAQSVVLLANVAIDKARNKVVVDKRQAE